MHKAEMYGRFVAKAGFAPADESAKLVQLYKVSKESGSLTFGEWAVMSNRLTPDQARTVMDFFDSSRFQCLECGEHVHGRDFTDPFVMYCPFCNSREFQLRGTALSTVAKTRKPGRAPSPPPGGEDSGVSESGTHITRLIDASEGMETKAISRAPKLPMSGESSGILSVKNLKQEAAEAEKRKKAEGEGRKVRAVPFELLQVMKGKPLDEFLKDLPHYRLKEWEAALKLIVYMRRSDLVHTALADAKRRFSELAVLSMVLRAMPTTSAAVHDFVFELVCQTASAVARLGAFMAHQEDALERPIAVLAISAPGPQLEKAQGEFTRLAAAEVVDLVAFLVRQMGTQDVLSALQAQWLPMEFDFVDSIRQFVAHPEPFVRALIAFSARYPSSPVELAQLEAQIMSEDNPFVLDTLHAALDSRSGEGGHKMSTFDKVLILKQTPLFSNLDRESLIAVAQVAEEESVPDHGIIIEQDTPGDAAYILVEGRVDVLRIDADQSERKVGELSAPHFFGEMAILI